MTTREAFKKLMEESPVKLAEQVELSASRLRQLRSDILNHDKWPSIEVMEGLLLKGGYKVKQEKLWEEKVKSGTRIKISFDINKIPPGKKLLDGYSLPLSIRIPKKKK